MGSRVIKPADFEWLTRPHEPGEPARHVAELSETAGFAHTRANVWRYEPGAKGRRHRHPFQEETFVVLAGTLSMYVGDPPERHERAGRRTDPHPAGHASSDREPRGRGSRPLRLRHSAGVGARGDPRACDLIGPDGGLLG